MAMYRPGRRVAVQALACFSREFGQSRLGRFPNDVDVYAVVGMPQSVPHPANIAPGLARHEFLGAFTEPVGCLADPLDTAFDGIPGPFVLFERLAIHAGEIARDPLRILDHVVEAVRRVVPRRQ
jgi:hypothetical protein